LRKEQLSKSNGYYHKIHPVEAETVDKNLADAAAAAEAKKKAAAEAAAKAAAAKAAAAATPETKPAAAASSPPQSSSGRSGRVTLTGQRSVATQESNTQSSKRT
jgi:membrane protein involved in colicin uptake